MKVIQLTKNSFSIFDGSKNYLQSYESIIAVIDLKKGQLTVGKNWNYSKTNIRHLCSFIDNAFFRTLLDEIEQYQTRELGIKYMICHGKIQYDESMQ